MGLDFVCIFSSIIMLVYSLKKAKNGFGPRVFFFWFFFVIFVLPLVLDYVVGKPNYMYYGSRMTGFIDSYEDYAVRTTYDIFLLFVELVLLFHEPKIKIKKSGNNYIGKPNLSISPQNLVLSSKSLNVCIILAAIVPCLCFLYGKPQIMFMIGWREKSLFPELTSRGGFVYIEQFSFLGTTACEIMLFFKNKKSKIRSILIKLMAIFLLICNVNAESKRTIFLFALLGITYIYMQAKKGDDLIKSLFVIGGIVLVAIFVVVFVKVRYRGYSGFDSIYTSLRIDMFRDDTVKLVLYSILYPESTQVLSYPFESYLMQIGYFFVLSILIGKLGVPIPRRGYNFYLTAALMRKPVSDINFMTTSMFDEVIANFGIAGIIIIALFVSYSLHRIEQLDDFEKVLWLNFFVICTMFSLNFALIYLETIVLIHIYIKRIKNWNENTLYL